LNFFNTYISEKSIENAILALKSTFISEGKLVKEFEEQLEKKLGLVNPVALNSCTSALHLALILAGVDAGDEVILTPQTFIATGMAVLYQKATPVFADIQIETGNIDPESIKKKITNKTKAVIMVHWGGYPCDIDEINLIAKEKNIAVIEDAAHALGAVYKGKLIGSISRFTCFSFQAIKHLTTGDGGALCCLKEDDEHLARRRRWFDIDRKNSKPSILGEREYDAGKIGYKYHMNDLAASVGLGNLQDFKNNLQSVRKINNTYREQFKNIDGLTLLENKDDRESACWLFTMLVERREDFIRALKSRNVPASVVHLRIDSNSVFGGINNELQNMNVFNEKQVAVPIHCDLTDEDVELIINSVKAGW
jgi:perosamine synthetase